MPRFTGQNKKRIDPRYFLNELVDPEDEDTTPGSTTTLKNVVLDIAGIIPGVGEIADLANAIDYASKGDYLFAALSLISVIPELGDIIGKGTKLAILIGKAGKSVKKVKTLASKHRIVANKILDKATESDNETLKKHAPKMKEAFNIFARGGSTRTSDAAEEEVLSEGKPSPAFIKSWKAAGSPKRGSDEYRMWFNGQRKTDMANAQKQPQQAGDNNELGQAKAQLRREKAKLAQMKKDQLKKKLAMKYLKMQGKDPYDPKSGLKGLMASKSVEELKKGIAKASTLKQPAGPEQGGQDLKGGGNEKEKAKFQAMCAKKGMQVSGDSPGKYRCVKTQAGGAASPKTITGAELVKRGIWTKSRCPECQYGVENGVPFIINNGKKKKFNPKSRQGRQVLRAMAGKKAPPRRRKKKPNWRPLPDVDLS